MDVSNQNIKEELSVWMDEYKLLGSDIMKRIDLQHKNLSLHLVFLSAIAGYLFKYGLDNGFDNLITSELIVLVCIAPFISLVFTWRHLDHDSNIIDKANYIQNIIRPNVCRLIGNKGLLGFDTYLIRGRRKRFSVVGAFALLGNDHIITTTYSIIYLLIGWYLKIYKVNYAGDISTVYNILLWICSVGVVITIYMIINTVIRYDQIGVE